MSDSKTTLPCDTYECLDRLWCIQRGICKRDELQTTRPDDAAREAAWTAYQDRLGNLTSNEEAMIERAFKSGWAARDPKRRERVPFSIEGNDHE